MSAFRAARYLGISILLGFLQIACSAPRGPAETSKRASLPAGEKPINGILIDSSRLLERKDYYDRLVDFLAEWNIGTLVWHFSDDHGCSIQIPGFEKLAAPGAFTVEETRRWVQRARDKRIDIIPELESFGHSRYITDHPDFRDLAAGSRTDRLTFNALDPSNPKTLVLMGALIEAVAGLFPSPYIHLGCDEVDVSTYLEDLRLDETAVSSAYLNALFDHARGYGKTPMIWDDYVVQRARIADRLPKDVVIVHYDYDREVSPRTTRPVQRLGFDRILLAPALSSWHERILPSQKGLRNTVAMARLRASRGLQGVLTTIWLPQRYIQNAMYYGIAFSGYAVAHDGEFDLAAFHREFARKVFATELTPVLDHFLQNWSFLEFDVIELPVFRMILEHSFRLGSWQLTLVSDVNQLAAKLLTEAATYTPAKNADILSGMVLAVRTAWVLSEAFILKNVVGEAGRASDFSSKLDGLVRDLDAEWDRTRDPNDPAKYAAKFGAFPDSHLLLVLRELRTAFSLVEEHDDGALLPLALIAVFVGIGLFLIYLLTKGSKA